MARFSTFKTGGPAEAVLFADELDKLLHLIHWLKENNILWRVIGKGSNILVPDEGFPGVVIILGHEFSCIEPVYSGKDRMRVKVGAGCSLAKLIAFCKTTGLAGLEFAVGIPGGVGGAVITNAGAWGHEISQFINSVQIISTGGEVQTLERNELKFSYRQWQGEKGSIILFCVFDLIRGNKKKITELCRDYAKRRRQQQPQGVASAGSFFKNPPGQAAGKLIEDAGLKGFKIRGAMVSPQHANFIINTGTASAHDILELMQEIQTRIFTKFGIMLEPEVHILKENG